MGCIFGILVKGIKLTISFEEYLRFNSVKGMCYSYYKTRWIKIPVLALNIFDMLIALYFALNLHSVVAYAFSNILFHLFSISIMMILFSLVLWCYDYSIINEPERFLNDNARSFFIVNTLIHLPILLIKAALIYFYSEDIGELVHSASNLSILEFQLIWISVSVPLFVFYGTTFVLLYWTIFPLIPILFLLLSPGYILDREISLTYYYFTDNVLDTMYRRVAGRKSREDIDNQIIEDYLTCHEITQTQFLTGKCQICSTTLNINKMSIIRLDCKHIYHLSCIQLWIAQKGKWCPCCSTCINCHPSEPTTTEIKSWVIKMHYFPAVLSLMLHEKCLLGLNANSSVFSSWKSTFYFYFYFILNIIGCLCLPFISIFSQIRYISVISNCLIFAILFKLIISALAVQDLDFSQIILQISQIILIRKLKQTKC